MNLSAMTVLVMLLGAGTAWAGPAHDGHAVGASVEELLELAARLNPEQIAAALEAEAALARAEQADALPDPKLQITFDDIARNGGGLPGRVGTVKYTLSQELPAWGKRGLQREIAAAEGREMLGRRDDVAAEIALRVKVAYADYHRVHLAMDQTDELIQVFRALVEFARFRYAQGLGEQQEATSAEAERGAMAAERVRLEKERHRIRARLNALINRSPDAQVVEHPRLRPLPPPERLALARERALAANPGLRMGQARLEAAEGGVRLADRNGLPDVGLSFGLVERRDAGMDNGFEAMVEVNLPLNWDRRDAQRREAAARQRAARAALDAQRVGLEAGLHEALLSLEEARLVEKVSRDTLLPQARIALQSALKSYENGTTEAVAVLDAVQRLKRFQIDLLTAQYDQQVRLAEIERLAGGE